MLKKIALLGIFAAMLCIAGCDRKDDPVRISLETKGNAPITEDNKNKIRIAVGGMITPREGLAYYKHFLDYIGEKLGRHVEFVDRESYADINNLLKEGRIDAAFVCSGPYVDGHDEFGLELLVAPQAYGGTIYFSYIIAGRDSSIKDFEGFRGKSFAFTDPLSNTGKLVPTFMLAKMNEKPETFFKKFIYTKSHDKSTMAVAHGLIDGAGVDSLIWEYLNRTSPELTSKTRIVSKSPPYAIPPVVVPRDLDPDLKTKLKSVFLNAHADEKGKRLLDQMMIEKFVTIEDSAYDSIREMKAWSEKLTSGKMK